MIDDSRPDETGGDSGERKFGPTEVSVVPYLPEDLTPKQRLTLVVAGLLAIVVGVMGLLGMNVFDRDRRR